MIHLNDTPGYKRSFLKDVTYAKVSVCSECLWLRDVELTEEDGVYVGSVESDPLFTSSHGLMTGDRVTFTPNP